MKTMTIEVTPEQYWQLKRLVRDIEAMDHTGRFRGHQLAGYGAPDRYLRPWHIEVEATWNYAVEKILGYRLEPLTWYELKVVRG